MSGGRDQDHGYPRAAGGGVEDSPFGAGQKGSNKCQSPLLTLPGRADKGLPCRASYALSILGPCITS
jgi:hypothetical protein